MTRTLIVAALVLLGLGGLFLALRPESTSSNDEPREQVHDVDIEDDAMSPAEINAGQGDQVTLRFTSDAPVEVHLHGYDLEAEVERGEETELSFEAELTGQFEIEDHETEAPLGTLFVEPR
ncbi:MAG: cupredoxin domain-containing protein [Rubrobacter sp.]|nr:cupredoxin domain-containing protein [Rubrobacter sp.]